MRTVRGVIGHLAEPSVSYSQAAKAAAARGFENVGLCHAARHFRSRSGTGLSHRQSIRRRHVQSPLPNREIIERFRNRFAPRSLAWVFETACHPSLCQSSSGCGAAVGPGGWPTYILRPTCRSAPRGVDSGVGERRQEPRVFGRVGRPGRPTFPGCGWYQAVRTAPQAREFVREVW